MATVAVCGGVLTVSEKGGLFPALTFVPAHGGLVKPAQTVTLHRRAAALQPATERAADQPGAVAHGNELWMTSSAVFVAVTCFKDVTLIGSCFAPASAAPSVMFWRLRW